MLSQDLSIKGQLDRFISDKNQEPRVLTPTHSLPHPLLSAFPLSLFPGYIKEKDIHTGISVSYTHKTFKQHFPVIAQHLPLFWYLS